MIAIPSHRSALHGRARGFSMIEVLVTLLIISLALLGTAGLQAYSMRLNQGGQFRTQAVFLAADLAERIEANKAGNYVMSWDFAGSGAYDVSGTNPQNCLTATCTSDDLATFDKWQWQRVAGDPSVLPQSSWTVTRAVAGTLTTYTIVVSWVDRMTGTGTNAAFNAAPGFGVNAAGTGERFSYTAIRTISN
jgi:type IV pilus assembly protein PilV